MTFAAPPPPEESPDAVAYRSTRRAAALWWRTRDALVDARLAAEQEFQDRWGHLVPEGARVRTSDDGAPFLDLPFTTTDTTPAPPRGLRRLRASAWAPDRRTRVGRAIADHMGSIPVIHPKDQYRIAGLPDLTATDATGRQLSWSAAHAFGHLFVAWDGVPCPTPPESVWTQVSIPEYRRAVTAHDQAVVRRHREHLAKRPQRDLERDPAVYAHP